MRCSSCGHENRSGRKFCSECGTPLAVLCASCGAANEPGERFCGECGRPLEATAVAEPAVAAVPSVERRLVSVLFADLVGFTPLSESRDAEEVRGLLSRYFETARTVIGRYGGNVEKFIGDAVMAVWGAPTAQEDDAERAVRAGLELVDAVAALGDGLAARVGVLTGEAAVTVGAEGQGMVAGDLVNTASRVQSAAEAGTVLVGETTRRASEAAIAYADAGEFELKGKTEPQRLWRALHVEAGRGGGMRTEALEPPFVGRERELRLVKELFHSSAEQGKAHLVSVLGIAGIGKSRLAWELEKYLDGLTQVVYWHRGRCLAYGEGVTYWALAEMLRGRTRIAEGEDPAEARAKLRGALAEAVDDAAERDWIEPRLAQLLGIEERESTDRDDLFGAWRLFFERLAERAPVALVFEDVQWADAALLDFVHYLLEWSRNHALFVLALARPDVTDRHPGWPGVKRNATTLALEPLPDEAMEALLDGVVPGLPEDTRAQILARAEGVPLYAVETVRMLLDRGMLERDGDVFRPAGPIESLAVPETLQALVAARLDALAHDERLLLQDAAVLGKTFTRAGLTAVSGRSEAELDEPLAALARKEILVLQTDPRSPERGQYGFLQDLLRQVAYDTLARRERKARHLAAAAYLESVSDELESVEVVAAHYLAAHAADPESDDAPAVAAKARAMLVRAGERAGSLAAGAEGQRYLEQALELAEDPREQAELHERAGRMARLAGRLSEARSHFELSIAGYEAVGQTHAAARVTAALGDVAFRDGRLEDGLAATEHAFAVLSEEEPDSDLATLAAESGRLLMVAGRLDESLARVEVALEIAEALDLADVFAHALNTKGVLLGRRGRRDEGLLLIRHALEVALAHDLSAAALRAYNNLSATLDQYDRLREAYEAAAAGLALADRVGDRWAAFSFRQARAGGYITEGLWDAAEPELDALVAEEDWTSVFRVPIHLYRGEVAEARLAYEASLTQRDPAHAESEAAYLAYETLVLRGEGRFADALAASDRALALVGQTSMLTAWSKLALSAGLDAALALGNDAKADELLGLIEALAPGHSSPWLRAIGARYSARRAAAHDDAATAEAGFTAAEDVYRSIPLPLELAETQVEHAEWLASHGRLDDAEPLLAEAEGLFGRLRATPWLERIAACRASAPAVTA
jgi:predicted ATPase/class 3 adenylate cyclase